MNALVKKEVRLLLPSWVAAMFLALIQAITQPYDFYIASLLFFGMTMMALSSIGRESSLNTFSTMLAQPVERIRIWQTKLCVLAGAFLCVFGTWFFAYVLALRHSTGGGPGTEDPYYLFITICLIATSTFTGGLWAALLFRQPAGAFWLTLLVPATLSGIVAAFLSVNQNDNGVIAGLCVCLGIYSIGGFFFARWLFFRAQDVGWTGGVITLPQWKIFAARSEMVDGIRSRKPLTALLKKELQLQQVSLLGAAGLLVLHISVDVLRTHHKFARDSAGEILTSIFWLLWLVLPVIVGSMSVAEERRLGVMEGQLCQPVSRRVQFIIKGFVTLCLGIFLGGVMPCVLETTGGGFSGFHRTEIHDAILLILALAAWLSLVGFFASSLAKNFLQAIGFAMGTFIICSLAIPVLANGGMIFFDRLPEHLILPLIIAAPTLVVTFLLAAYLNFKNFRSGWHLWRRSLILFGGAILFVIAASTVVYNRAWEFYRPVEPAHGPARLSLANPPTLQIAQYYDLLVRLPDGRVWFDYLGTFSESYDGNTFNLRRITRTLLHPLTESLGPQQFLAGSNWVSATTERLYFGWDVGDKHHFASGFMDTVGIQPDGSLWCSENPAQDKWAPGKMLRYGTETNWSQLAQSRTSVVLLKTDGTLWRWGALTNDLHQWPGLHAFIPCQIGTNSDWRELFCSGGIFARRANGRVWAVNLNWNTGKDELDRETSLDEVVSQTTSRLHDEATAFIRPDGTLWVLNRYWDVKTRLTRGHGILQVGKASDWRAVAMTWNMMVALKADGSLWQWHFNDESIIHAVNVQPTRLGIHDDRAAITRMSDGVVALAGDGSLWFWPDRNPYSEMLLKLPKQPQFLGNVFAAGH